MKIGDELELEINEYYGEVEVYLGNESVCLDLLPKLVEIGLLTEEEAQVKRHLFTTKVPVLH